MNVLIAIVKTISHFGHTCFKKQLFWPCFIRTLAISYRKYLATLAVVLEENKLTCLEYVSKVIFW